VVTTPHVIASCTRAVRHLGGAFSSSSQADGRNPAPGQPRLEVAISDDSEQPACVVDDRWVPDLLSRITAIALATPQDRS
jgi:hypothetical protein